VARLSALLSTAIREAREGAEMSQEELADRASLHRTYISLVERSKRNLSVDALDRIARALDTSASELIATAERGRGKRLR